MAGGGGEWGADQGEGRKSRSVGSLVFKAQDNEKKKQA